MQCLVWSYAPDAAKRQAQLYLRDRFGLGATNTSLKDRCDRLLGCGLTTEGDILGELINPAVQPCDLPHPYDPGNLLDLPNVLLKPCLPGLQTRLSSLDGVHLGQQLQQQGLQVVHGDIVPLVELASYNAPALPSTPADSTWPDQPPREDSL